MEPVPVAKKYAKRLTAEQAAQVREMKGLGATYKQISKRFGISKQSAILIVKYRTHRVDWEEIDVQAVIRRYNAEQARQ